MEGAQPLRSCYAPCSAMPWACLEKLTLISPARGNGKRLPPNIVSVSKRTPSDHGTSCFDSQIGGQVQEFLAGLHAEWEERLTRWTLVVRNTLEAGDALPPFPTAAVATSGDADPALAGEPVIRGQEDQGDTAGGSVENRQAEGNRDVTLGGQEGTPRTIASAATATPTTAMSAPNCEGENETAARGIRGRQRGLGEGHE